MASDFMDFDHWKGLASKHLGRYTYPDGNQPCSVESMMLWLDRLDLDEDDFLAAGAKLDEFIELNPTWPIGAWLGLALEIKDEIGQ